MIEIYKWMNGYNKGDINKVLVLVVREQGRTRNNGFKVDKFRFSRDRQKLVYQQGSGRVEQV